MIERAAVRFNPDDWYEMEVDTDAVSCAVHGFMNGEPIDFSGGGGDTPSVVVGDFTPETTGVNVFETSYDGNGYPIAILIWADELPTGFSYPNVLMAIRKWVNDRPTYNENTAVNQASVVYIYTSEFSDFYDYSSKQPQLYDNVNDPHYNDTEHPIIISDKKTIKYYATLGSVVYGFGVNVKYNYMILYSE